MQLGIKISESGFITRIPISAHRLLRSQEVRAAC